MWTSLSQSHHNDRGENAGWRTMAGTSVQAPSMPGMLRSLLGADRGFAGLCEAGQSQQDVPSALITFGMREGTGK
jgi:hypothetical protein